MHKIGSSPISWEDFQYSRRYHKWGIGIGSSPIGYEGFVQPWKGQGEARLNSYYNNFISYSCSICPLPHCTQNHQAQTSSRPTIYSNGCLGRAKQTYCNDYGSSVKAAILCVCVWVCGWVCGCVGVWVCVCGGNPCSEGLLSWYVQFLVSAPNLQAGAHGILDPPCATKLRSWMGYQGWSPWRTCSWSWCFLIIQACWCIFG